MEFHHRPPHPRVVKHLFEGDARKILLREVLQSKTKKFSVTLRAWVLLDNHYHLLCRFFEANVMSRFIGELHGASAHKLNQFDGVIRRSVWQNYWDKCIQR